MEDFSWATALAALGRARRANATRLTVLRSVSDYSYEPTGAELATWFFTDDHACEDDAFRSLVAAGTPLLEDVLRGAAP